VFGQGGERKKTLGEFDFILMSFEQKRYQHLELACKYYLGTKQEESVSPSKTARAEQVEGPLVSNNRVQGTRKSSKLNHWVGPGCNDRLDIKVSRLLDHQLLLSQSNDGARRLNELGVSPVELRYLLKGQFFYPAYTELPPPEDAGEKHLKGLWWSEEECAKAVQDLTIALGPWRFTQIYNIEYMAPRRHNLYEHPSLGQDQFLDYVSRHFTLSPHPKFTEEENKRQQNEKKFKLATRPLALCIEPIDNEQSNIYLKVFIVPSCWGATAREYSES